MKAWLSPAWGMLAVLTASPLSGQVLLTNDGAAAHTVRVAIVREIDDPATGNRWLLERQAVHPGGPGRLVLAAGSNGTLAKVENAVVFAGKPIPVPAVIRAGDAVTLVAHTAVMDAELEAVALAPATAGAAFPARLKMGGRTVQAVALRPGQAEWAPQSEEAR